MKKWIDLKSLVIGGVLVLSVMYVLGAAPRPTVASEPPIRRFTLVLSNLPGGEAFVLDTATGEVWPRQSRGGANAFYGSKLKTQTSDEPNESRL